MLLNLHTAEQKESVTMVTVANSDDDGRCACIVLIGRIGLASPYGRPIVHRLSCDPRAFVSVPAIGYHRWVRRHEVATRLGRDIFVFSLDFKAQYFMGRRNLSVT